MNSLTIQLQSQLCDSAEVSQLVHKLVTNAQSHPDTANVSVTSGDDGGPFTNINVQTHQVAKLWAYIGPLIVKDKMLSSCVIACCEGNNEWDDYLLLYHFDKSEAIDALP